MIEAGVKDLQNLVGTGVHRDFLLETMIGEATTVLQSD
jgi:hypothetical protein